MKYQFKDFDISVPACCLIEDYQALVKAKLTGDWDEVETVIECLQDAISTSIDKMKQEGKLKVLGLQFTPSATSLIAMSCDNGIVCNEDGSDIQCAGGHNVSEVDAYDPCGMCPHNGNDCDPSRGEYCLNCGFTYDMKEMSRQDEPLLKALDAAEQ